MFAKDIEYIMKSRHSVRAFKDKKVSKLIIQEILEAASRAPSGCNTQPWRVYVVQGSVRDEIVNAVCQVYDDSIDKPGIKSQYQAAYDYYPQEWFSPYIERRRENGWGLYGLLGIEKQDKDKMSAQQRRNFMLFDAPVGLFLTFDRRLGTGSKMDISMFIQNILLMAIAKGLDTCPQAAWNEYQSIVLPKIKAGKDEELLCTIALGYADKTQIVNEFTTPREPVDSFTTWLGFDES
ncbi:MAG: nitroreductase [Neisseriaceae bacterium]|nr:MAG: nitroreductase [Neisseriaceae bacterium]